MAILTDPSRKEEIQQAYADHRAQRRRDKRHELTYDAELLRAVLVRLSPNDCPLPIWWGDATISRMLEPYFIGLIPIHIQRWRYSTGRKVDRTRSRLKSVRHASLKSLDKREKDQEKLLQTCESAVNAALKAEKVPLGSD